MRRCDQSRPASGCICWPAFADVSVRDDWNWGCGGSERTRLSLASLRPVPAFLSRQSLSAARFSASCISTMRPEQSSGEFPSPSSCRSRRAEPLDRCPVPRTGPLPRDFDNDAFFDDEQILRHASKQRPYIVLLMAAKSRHSGVHAPQFSNHLGSVEPSWSGSEEYPLVLGPTLSAPVPCSDDPAVRFRRLFRGGCNRPSASGPPSGAIRQ